MMYGATVMNAAGSDYRTQEKYFSKDHYALTAELMDMLANQIANDPFYQAYKGSKFENHPEYLQTLKSSLKVRDGERILTYVEDALVFRGTTGMIVTENGIYYKGVMEMAKFTTWFELMNSPINILLTNGTAVSLRIKKVLGHKPFAPAFGENHGNDCADFWIRIKQTIAEYYGMA